MNKAGCTKRCNLFCFYLIIYACARYKLKGESWRELTVFESWFSVLTFRLP